MKHLKKLKIIVVLAASLILLLGLFSVASAKGSAADQLENAGWGCEIAGPHGWLHCFGPGGGQTIRVKVFSADGDTFLGTELLIHASVYAGQPCATDGGAPYTDLQPALGIPYYACHFFNTGG